MWYGYVSERYAATSRDVCTQLTVICSSLWYRCDMSHSHNVSSWGETTVDYCMWHIGYSIDPRVSRLRVKREGVSTKERVCQAARQKRGCVNTWNGLNHSIKTTILTHYSALSQARTVVLHPTHSLPPSRSLPLPLAHYLLESQAPSIALCLSYSFPPLTPILSFLCLPSTLFLLIPLSDFVLIFLCLLVNLSSFLFLYQFQMHMWQSLLVSGILLNAFETCILKRQLKMMFGLSLMYKARVLCWVLRLSLLFCLGFCIFPFILTLSWKLYYSILTRFEISVSFLSSQKMRVRVHAHVYINVWSHLVIKQRKCPSKMTDI